MRKLYLLLALLLTFSSSAWADFDQPWTNTPSPWSNEAATGVPQAVTSLVTQTDGTVYSSTVEAVRLEGDSRSITVGFTLESGHTLTILGVELLNSNQEVITASSVYERKQAGSNKAGAIYTLSTNGVTAGTYYLRYYVCVGSTQNITGTNGIITVRGLNAAGGTGLTNYKSITSLNDLSNDKLYLLKSGRSFGSTSNHYLLWNGSVAPNNLSCTYLAKNSMNFSAESQNFQFAIYKSGNAYYLYNMAAGKFVGNNDNNNGAIPMVKMPTNQVYFKASENGTYNWMLSTNDFIGALNAANTNNGALNWTGGKDNKTDLGNCFNIIEVADNSALTSIANFVSIAENHSSWVAKYNEVVNALSSRIEGRVGDMTANAVTSIENTCNNLINTPSEDNYNNMVNAYTNREKITLNEGEVFTIQCKETDRGYLAYSPSHSKTHAYLAGTGGSWVSKFPATTAEGVSIKWAYYEKDGKKYIYNYDNKVFIGAQNWIIPVNIPKYVTFNPDQNNPLIHRICFEGKTNTMLSFSPGYNGIDAVRTYVDVNDGGVQFYLVKTGDSPISTEVAAVAYEKAPLKKKLNEMPPVGTGVGKYNNDSKDAERIVADANSVSNSDAATSVQVTAALAGLNALVLIINQPEAGKLYRFKNKAANRYMKENGKDQQMDMTDITDLHSSIFMLREGNDIDGQKAFKLLSYTTGYYTKDTRANGATADNANSVLFKESEAGNLGYYTLKTTYTAAPYIFGRTDNNLVDRNGTYQANNCDWQIEEVTWLPIPISDVYKFATFYSPVDLAISDAYYSQDERLKFYTATIGTDGYVELKKVTDNIPAGKAYVVEYVEGSEYKNNCSYMKIAPSAPVLSAENALHGSYETVATPTNEGTIYTLQAAWLGENSVSATEVAFRQYNGATIQGFRAYLPVAGNVRIAGMRIVDGDVTRIEGVSAEESHKVDVYDLSGRRVQRATKGLYIINGKKVIVK